MDAKDPRCEELKSRTVRMQKEEKSEISKYRIITQCRVCESTDLASVLELGMQPLANSLKSGFSQPENKFPLTLLFCAKCSLAQLRETIDKEILFKKYLWVTGTSSTACSFANNFYSNVLAAGNPSKKDLIVEIASNDGTFLKPFRDSGYNAFGVEPAENIAELANRNGVKTVHAFWNRETAGKIVEVHGNPKVIIARNVIPHVSDLHEVVDAFRFCLATDGTGVIEFHDAGIILDELHYDSIYHEHLCYFSIKTMGILLRQFGLEPFHLDYSPISGGGYIIYFSKKKRVPSAAYSDFTEKENRRQVNHRSSWEKFAENCREHKTRSKEILKSFVGKTIVGFGSSARSSTYLNFCGFTDADIRVIIDNNKLKQGLFSAGSSIPIVSMSEGLALKPDIIFVLAWNFLDEIIRLCKDHGYRGKFLVSFPRAPKILEGDT